MNEIDKSLRRDSEYVSCMSVLTLKGLKGGQFDPLRFFLDNSKTS